MGRFTPAKAATDPAVQSAIAELQEAIAPFQRVIAAYGRSQPAPDHAVLRVHGPKGARAEVRFADFTRLVALLEPPASAPLSQGEDADATAAATDASTEVASG
jgi:hypothetical protein